MSKRWWKTTLYWRYLERANNIREIRKKEEELNFDITNCNKFNEKNTDLIHIYNAADEPLGENENLWTYIQRKCILLSKSAFFSDFSFEETTEVGSENANSTLMDTNFASAFSFSHKPRNQVTSFSTSPSKNNIPDLPLHIYWWNMYSL